MTIQISGWSSSLTDLKICTLALCATIIVCTIGAVFVVVGFMVGVIYAAWHGPKKCQHELGPNARKAFGGHPA